MERGDIITVRFGKQAVLFCVVGLYYNSDKEEPFAVLAMIDPEQLYYLSLDSTTGSSTSPWIH